MNIQSILTPERTCCGLVAASKKRAIEEAAAFIAGACPELPADAVYEHLINREKLGTTAMGHGIAIPHCRMASCENIIGGLFTLAQPVDFGAYDDKHVSILFALVVPAEENEDHLKALALLAERFESEAYRQSLLLATTSDELYRRAIAEVPVRS